MFDGRNSIKFRYSIVFTLLLALSLKKVGLKTWVCRKTPNNFGYICVLLFFRFLKVKKSKANVIGRYANYITNSFITKLNHKTFRLFHRRTSLKEIA